MKWHKKKPCPVWYTEQGEGTNLSTDIVSVLIVAREKGKGNEKKARVQDYMGHAP